MPGGEDSHCALVDLVPQSSAFHRPDPGSCPSPVERKPVVVEPGSTVDRSGPASGGGIRYQLPAQWLTWLMVGDVGEVTR